MSLLEDQAKQILALEKAQREVLLSSVIQAREEIRQAFTKLDQSDSLLKHYSQLQTQIDEILQKVDPQLNNLPYAVGQQFGTELASNSASASLALPALNLQALSQIELDSVTKIRKVTDDLRTTVGNQLRTSLALGEGILQATERITTTGFRRSLWRYELIARTATNEMVNKGALSTYRRLAEQHPKLNLKKQWNSTLDRRTSTLCQILDGEIQPVDTPFSLGYMAPPALPNCRSRLVAVTSKYDPTPKLEDYLKPIETSDKGTNKALAKGRKQILAIPGLDQAWTDYHRVVHLKGRYYTYQADKILELERDNRSGKISNKRFAKERSRIRQDWYRTPEGRACRELEGRIKRLSQTILNAGVSKPEGIVKQTVITELMESPFEGLKFSPREISTAKRTLNQIFSLMPKSALAQLPDRYVPNIGGSYYINKHTPVRIAKNLTNRDYRIHLIHESFHALEESDDKEALSQAILVRATLAESRRTVYYNGGSYELYEGKGLGVTPYAGRIYADGSATEYYTTAAETLLDGIRFINGLIASPSQMALLFSKLTIKF